MCDTMQVSKNDDEAPIRCVSISDKCYLISLWHCYEDVIEWHRKRVMGELNKYPTDHDWTGDDLQPKDQQAKDDAIGKMSWTEESKDNKKNKKHYFEPKPDPKVSNSEADLTES